MRYIRNSVRGVRGTVNVRARLRRANERAEVLANTVAEVSAVTSAVIAAANARGTSPNGTTVKIARIVASGA